MLTELKLNNALWYSVKEAINKGYEFSWALTMMPGTEIVKNENGERDILILVEMLSLYSSNIPQTLKGNPFEILVN